MNILIPFFILNYECSTTFNFSTILHVYVAIFFVTVANLVQGTSSHTNDDGMVIGQKCNSVFKNAACFNKKRLFFFWKIMK